MPYGITTQWNWLFPEKKKRMRKQTKSPAIRLDFYFSSSVEVSSMGSDRTAPMQVIKSPIQRYPRISSISILSSNLINIDLTVSNHRLNVMGLRRIWNQGGLDVCSPRFRRGANTHLSSHTATLRGCFATLAPDLLGKSCVLCSAGVAGGARKHHRRAGPTAISWN